MFIYLDILFLDNFCIDFALLFAAIYTLKGKCQFWKIFFTAFLGAMLALLYTVLFMQTKIPTIFNSILKYGVACLLPIMAAKFKSITSYILSSILFVFYMFALAGLFTALYLHTEFISESGLIYTLKGVPTGIIVLGAFVFIVIIFWCIRRVKRRVQDIPYICNCSMHLQNKSIYLQALVDTGNRVQDKDGKFVVFVEKYAVQDFFVKNNLEKEIENCLEVKTIVGKKSCQTFKIDTFKIYYKDKQHIHTNVTIAICEEKMSGEYRVIISPLCFSS